MTDVNSQSSAGEAAQDDHRIGMSRSEALVLFELLSRWFAPERSLPDEYFEHGSEVTVLLNMLGGLEKHLIEPFLPDYTARLEIARAEITN